MDCFINHVKTPTSYELFALRNSNNLFFFFDFLRARDSPCFPFSSSPHLFSIFPIFLFFGLERIQQSSHSFVLAPVNPLNSLLLLLNINSWFIVVFNRIGSDILLFSILAEAWLGSMFLLTIDINLRQFWNNPEQFSLCIF